MIAMTGSRVIGKSVLVAVGGTLLSAKNRWAGRPARSPSPFHQREELMPVSQRSLFSILLSLLLIAICASPLAAQRDTTKASPTAMDTASAMVSSAAAGVQWTDLK